MSTVVVLGFVSTVLSNLSERTAVKFSFCDEWDLNFFVEWNVRPPLSRSIYICKTRDSWALQSGNGQSIGRSGGTAVMHQVCGAE